MKRILLAVLIILCSFSLAAEPVLYGRMIESDSPLYDYADMLYSLCGLSKPGTNRPWSEGEARQIMSKIDPEELGDAALKMYECAMDIINDGPRWKLAEDSGVGIDLILDAEGYYHTDTENFNTAEDWVRGFDQRDPLVRVNFEFSSGSSFWTVSDIDYAYARGSVHNNYAPYIGTGLATQGSDGKWYIGSYEVEPSACYCVTDYYFEQGLSSNFFLDTYDFDFIFPRRAIVSLGGDDWNVSINRDRLKIGDAHLGNLLVDDYGDAFDSVRLSFFSDAFRYEWLVMPMNTQTGRHEVKSDEGRIFLIHTLDFRIADRISLKISENVMYEYDTLELQYFNPAYIYHNLNNRGMFNAIAYAEINAAPFKGMNVYALFAMDQARAPNEGYGQSDASGLILGLEYTFALPGAVVESYAELTRTTPLLYRRDGLDFIRVERYYHQGALNENESGDYYGHAPYFRFIGLEFGGDTRALKTGFKYEKPGIVSAEFYGLLLEHGEMTIYKSHNVNGYNNDSADVGGKTPSGDTITQALVLSAAAEISLSGFFEYPGLCAEIEIDSVGIRNYTKSTDTYSNERSDLQISAGISIAL